MALLRLSNGRIYTRIEEINPLIAPLKLGRFNYPEEFKRKVEALPVPLTNEGIKVIEDGLDPEAVGLVKGAGLVYTRIGAIIPPTEEGGPFTFTFGKNADDATPRYLAAEDVRDNLTPHVQGAVDCHFVMSGAIVKGLELENGLQGVIYVQAGEYFWLTPEGATNWVISTWGQPTIGFSFFNKEVGTFKREEREADILPEMRY